MVGLIPKTAVDGLDDLGSRAKRGHGSISAKIRIDTLFVSTWVGGVGEDQRSRYGFHISEQTNSILEVESLEAGDGPFLANPEQPR